MKRNSILFIIFGIILLTEISVGQFFPNLTFVNSNLRIANRILGTFAFSVFIFSVPIIFKVNKMLTFFFGIILSLFFLINSWGELFPFDTATEPKDISILQKYQNGDQLIVQACENTKTREIILDTILVKDQFIFRQIIEPKKTTNR